jgi:hypothetical protein
LKGVRAVRERWKNGRKKERLSWRISNSSCKELRNR